MRSLTEEQGRAISARLLRSGEAREELLRSCLISQHELDLCLRAGNGDSDGKRRETLGWFGKSGMALRGGEAAIDLAGEKNQRARAVFKDLEDLVGRGRGLLRLDIRCSACSAYDENEREWIYFNDATFTGIGVRWINCKTAEFDGTRFGYISYLFNAGYTTYVVVDPAITSLSLTVLDGKEPILTLPIFTKEQTEKLLGELVRFLEGLDTGSPLRSVIRRAAYMQRSYNLRYYPGVNAENDVRRKRPRVPIPLEDF